MKAAHEIEFRDPNLTVNGMDIHLQLAMKQYYNLLKYRNVKIQEVKITNKDIKIMGQIKNKIFIVTTNNEKTFISCEGQSTQYVDMVLKHLEQEE